MTVDPANPQPVSNPGQTKATTPQLPQGGQRTARTQAARRTERTPAGPPTGGGTDQVKISRDGKALQANEHELARRVVKETPEVRQDKVEAARKAVENGNQPSAAQIAGKMVNLLDVLV
ncbi:MAG: flagellar biosynthesis anti-sigma factor FlgM [Nitrospinae bacterium]|nr:flagellar biosynthesis anti-sigma factor FlgM [Nitrospinota bacterium]